MDNIFEIRTPLQLTELPLKRADSFDPNVDLEEKDRSQFQRFIHKLHDAVSDHQCLLLFRADRKSSIRSIYEKSVGNGINLFFLAGNKAKTYLEGNQTELQNREYLRHISDVTEETFEWIFETIQRLLREKKINSMDLTNIVEEFCLGNKKIERFFEISENVQLFKKYIGDSTLCETIRDYYLYLIHTISSKYLTFFISSSTDAKVLRGFCDLVSRDNIVTVFWIPLPIAKYGISQEQALEYQKIIASHNLPAYSSNFYPSEHEIAVKGAIFPHYIIGFYDPPSQSLVVSPHIANCNNLNSVIPQGFRINQSNFDHVIAKTGYGRFVTRFYNRTYKDEMI